MFKIRFDKKVKTKFFATIAFFLVVFNPPLIRGISFTPIAIAISFIYVIFHSRYASRIIYSKVVKKWMKILLMIFVYYAFGVAVNIVIRCDSAYEIISNYISTLIYNISIIFVSVAIVLVAYKNKYDMEDLFDCYIGAGVIEAFLGIASFLNPSIKAVLNNMVINNSTSEKVARSMNNVSSFRNYGLASTMFDSFGLGMSILALIALGIALYRTKPLYFFPFSIIAFTACINARTSMVLIGSGVIILLIMGSWSTAREIMGKIVGICIMTVALYLFAQMLKNGTATAKWISGGLNAIRSYAYNSEATGFFAIIKSEIVIPHDPFIFLFGSGLLPNQLGYKAVDMGYIQNIWKFGIIGSSMLYFYYILPLAMWYKKRVKESIIALVILVVLGIYLFKLNLFGYGIGSTVFMPIIMYKLFLLKNYSMKQQEELLVL